jgi:hypothetical protein
VTTEVFAFLASGGAVALITALVTGMFQRRKVAADVQKVAAEAQSVQVQNALKVFDSVMSTLQAQVGDQRTEIALLREQNTILETKYDAAAKKTEVLERHERLSKDYAADMTQYIAEITAELRALGRDVPEPPSRPPSRAERTRRDDR